MALKQKGTDAAAADPKKRRRVGFSGVGTKPGPRLTLSFPSRFALDSWICRRVRGADRSRRAAMWRLLLGWRFF